MMVDSDRSAPTGQLSAAKRALLAKRLRGEGSGTARSSIPRQPRTGPMPASYAQERLWFLHQLAPHSPLYNLSVPVRLSGTLHPGALEQALAAIVARHESLRTHFISEGGIPFQVIEPAGRAELRRAEVESLPEEQKHRELQRLLQEEARRPFDLTADSMLRALLIRLTPTEHRLVLTAHHMASDGWSTGVLLRELMAFYQEFVSGNPAGLPPLAIQYADFAAWQRDWLQGEELKKQIDWWRHTVSGAPDILELPSDRPRPPRQSFRGRCRNLVLPESLTPGITALTRKHSGTMFITLFAAFQVLLSRLTGGKDLLIGSPVAGRRLVETEPIVGLFTNTVVIRGNLAGNPSFIELLQRTREATLEAWVHQDLPLEKLVEELRPDRSSSATPLIQAMFSLQQGVVPIQTSVGLTLEPILEEIDTGTAKFDLMFHVQEAGPALKIIAEYSADLFDDSSIARLLQRYQLLLEGIVADPKRPIGQLPILTPEERQQILVDWSRTESTYPREATIHQLFEEQAARAPESVAVIFGEQRLSYRELDEWATRLAAELQSRNAGPGTLVAIALSRSLEMIPALLGILKAGAAYVALDPESPKSRMAELLSETGATVLLTSESLVKTHQVDQLVSSSGRPVEIICLDTDEKNSRQAPAQPISTQLDPGSLAYVSFTSGSTGRSKGVCVPHRAVVRLVKGADYASFRRDDVFLQFAPVAFDASTFEIWGALLNGAALAIFPPHAPSLAELGEFIKRHGITTLWLTSGLFHQMIEEQVESLRGVRQLLAGGDVLSASHVRKALQQLPECQLINGYGPTENTTFTCCHRIPRSLDETRSVPIGRPIANTRVYVLDDQMQPVPVGVAGELYAGGDGLALGYLNQPDLTAEKFVEHSFPHGTERLYKTGDCVRWLADGTLEFLGRADSQVKIHGFRVEPAEIEAALAGHGAVKRCAVTCHNDERAEKRLVAHVVPHPSVTVGSADLRRFLQDRLPQYMVPAAFVFLEQLPLQANGKVDRAALVPPNHGRPEGDGKLVGPRDSLETQMVAIWEDVLGVHPISVEDDFFELGGHSLLVVRLLARVERAFGKSLPVATVFQWPVLEQFTQRLRQEKSAAAAVPTSITEIQPNGSRPPLFLVHGAGGGMLWGYANLAVHLGTDQPVYAFKAKGLEGEGDPGPVTVPEMAAKYLAEMRRIQPNGPYYLGGYCFGGNIAYEIACQLEEQGQTVALLALLNSAPTHSRRPDFPRGLRWWLQFFRNAGNILASFVSHPWAEQGKFIAWRSRTMARRFVPSLAGPAAEELSIDTYVDLSSSPPEQRRLWRIHFQALSQHRDRAYGGPVTLLRSRDYPLWCSFDPTYGWSEFVPAGTTVQIVPGAHEQILEEPHVRMLAAHLNRILRETQRRQNGASAIPRRAVNDRTDGSGGPDEAPLPLSFVQEKLWQFEQRRPGTADHHIPIAIRLEGRLNVRALRQAFEEVVRRHPILRTIFPEHQGRTGQRILPEHSVTLRRVDVTGTFHPEHGTITEGLVNGSTSDRPPRDDSARGRTTWSDARLDLALQEARRPFEPRSRPMLRASLFRLSERDHVLLLVSHQMILDSDSERQLRDELRTCYECFANGAPVPLPRPPIDYADFALWQRNPDQARVRAAQFDYWKQQLDGSAAALELPSDHPRPATFSHRPDRQRITLDRATTDALRILGDGQRTSLPVTLLATVQAFASRYTSAEDTVIGVTSTHRNQDTDGVLGNFGNTLIVRTDLSGDPTFQELLARTSKAFSLARANGQVPIENLIEKLASERDDGRHPFCQLGFAFEPAESASTTAAGVAWTDLPADLAPSPFDLKFILNQKTSGLTGWLEYNAELYEPATVKRWITHWTTLLADLTAHPEHRLSEACLLTDKDEAQLLAQQRGPIVAYPRERCVHQLFEEQVVRSPGDIAVEFDGRSLTYEDLDNRANDLARELRRLGVGPDVPVGIALERSLDVPVAVLAILKAGGAYAPLDPAYPQDRIRLMIENARVPVLVSHSSFRSRLDIPLPELQWICVDEFSAPSWQRNGSHADNQTQVQPQHLAYIIHTSGSTGLPKGVAMPHRPLVNLITWQLKNSSAGRGRRTLQFASLSFDVSFQEMFGTWCAGGTLVLMKEELRRDPAALLRFIDEERIQRLFLPFVALQHLAEAFVEEGRPKLALREVITAGEQLQITPRIVEWFTRLPGCVLYNHYGPTESHVVTSFALSGPPEQWPALPPIGRPIDNVCLHVLDRHGSPVPIGVTGELFIGGDALAAGYIHRPELTAERFVPSTLPGSNPGDRLYKTGDLARYRADGNIEFLGRIDHQVKIRGFRVELGEVETALQKHPSLRDVVVNAYQNGSGPKRLAAYCVLKPGERLAGDEVRRWLGERLPEYMVPSFFVPLEKLPLTPNGKVDRKRLPAPDSDRPALENEYEAPRNAVEEKLARIWSEVLGVQKVGARDSFIDLGGHSLLAAQILSRIRRDFAVDLPLSLLFEAPTPAALAERISTEPSTASLPPLEPVERDGPAPLSFSQQRLWFIEQIDRGSPAYHVPVAVVFEGTIDADILEACLQSIVDRHEILRTRFITVNGEPVQEVASSVTIKMSRVDWSDRDTSDPERQRELLTTEARPPFDLTCAPLLGCRWIKIRDDRHILLVVMHHIVSDGWSLEIFFRELAEFYEARVGNRPAALRPLPIQYADYAAWQRRCLQGPNLERHLNYFKESLKGAPPSIPLPVDTPAGTNQISAGAAARTVTVPPDLLSALGRLQRQEGATSFMSLLACLGILLYRWTLQSDLVLGTVAAGRDRSEVESLIGCFMNFLPLRLVLKQTGSLIEALRLAKAAVLGAYSHADCPFEKIVEAVNPERRQTGNPIYNVGLLLQNFPGMTLSTPHLKGRPLTVDTGATLLDLRFVAEEIDGNLSITCEYPPAQFRHATIEHLLHGFLQCLDCLARQPATPISQIALAPELLSRAGPEEKKPQPEATGDILAIAATFTAEPMQDALQFWIQELGLPVRLEFAPYNQVFQQLLDPASLMSRNVHGLNVVLVRLEDWQRVDRESEPGNDQLAPEKIEADTRQLSAALRMAAARSGGEFLVCCCPSWKATQEDARLEAFFSQLEETLANDLSGLSSIRVVRSRELLALYPVSDIADPQGDRLGHVPYTPAFYAALGTMIARKMDAWKRPRPKVIVLDCDQTLWSGVCAEDTPQGVQLDPPRRVLQEFMRERMSDGVLLALCSKNEAADVDAVFSSHPQMPLRREDFAGARINWKPKSENLRALAHELNLGLDSLVFVDDSPIECAEVEANAPEVLVLQTPANAEELPNFLKHCWIFDRWKITSEDRQRTALYQQNRAREELRTGATTLQDFIEQLGLEVRIEALAPEQLTRAAQLTQKTNQFNLTTRRRTESAIRELQQLHQAEVLVTSVRDRFGDYGLVGVIICNPSSDALVVDTLLLSCRVLGRGVEHQMVARLGQIARDRGLRFVDLLFQASPRNQPAREFLDGLESQRQDFGEEVRYRMPAEAAARLTFKPAGNAASTSTEGSASASARTPSPTSALPKFTRCAWIARETAEPERLFRLIGGNGKVEARTGSDYAPPASELEGKLCEIWQELLHVDRIGVNDDFFALGGHSLLAVRLFANIEKDLQVALPVVTIFQAATVAELARVISEKANALPSRLMPIQPNGARRPLFLIHGAGGDILWGYANLARHMNSEQPIFGIQARTSAGAKDFTTLEEMAADYLIDIRAHQPNGPYYLGGYCFGGNVAYEIARQLRAQGEVVALVALLDCAPSNTGYERVRWWLPSFPFVFARNFYYWADDFFQLKPAEQRNLFKRKLGALQRKLARRWRGVRAADAVDLDEVIDTNQFPEQELELWKAHLRLLVEHVSQPYGGHVALFRTRGHPLFCSFERDFGWGKLVHGGVAVKFVPGSHESIFAEPNVASLATTLESLLEPEPARTAAQKQSA